MDQFIEYYNFRDYEKAIEDSKTGRTIKAVLKWA